MRACKVADVSISEETLKTLRLTHLLGIGVAATALIVLFAPFQVDFTEALKEAALLKSLNITEYEMYVRGMVASPDVLPKSGIETGRGAAGDILQFMQGKKVCCISTMWSPDWSAKAALKYSPPPKNGSLEEWSKWMSSDTPAQFWTPDWTKSSVSMDTRWLERPKDQEYRMLLFFSVEPDDVNVFSTRPSDSVVWPSSDYRFFAFFQDGMFPPKQIDVWWPEVIGMEDPKRWDPAWRQTIDKAGRSVVEGVVQSHDATLLTTRNIGAGSVNLWLRTHPRLKDLFAPGREAAPLPHLHEQWSLLSSRSLNEAISYMQQQQQAFRDVAILGVTVPGQLCVVALPLAFMAAFGYLYLHLRMAVATAPRGIAISFPWIGVYDDRLSAFVTTLSLTVVPSLLLSGIFYRYWSRLGLLSAVSSAILAVFAISLGVFADLKTRELRCLTRAVAGVQKVSAQEEYNESEVI